MELIKRRQYGQQAEMLVLLDRAEHGKQADIDKLLKLLRNESY